MFNRINPQEIRSYMKSDIMRNRYSPQGVNDDDKQYGINEVADKYIDENSIQLETP